MSDKCPKCGALVVPLGGGTMFSCSSHYAGFVGEDGDSSVFIQSDKCQVRTAMVLIARLVAALKWYADPGNTVRDCMDGGSCANCDHCKLAQETLGLDENGKEK